MLILLENSLVIILIVKIINLNGEYNFSKIFYLTLYMKVNILIKKEKLFMLN